MGRPHIEREIAHPPLWKHFSPGIKSRRGKVFLHLDEYEAIRLSDYLGYSHNKAALKMGISRPTFTRLIGSAHKKIGEAIALGKEIFIYGGNVHFRKDILQCRSCGKNIPLEPGTPFPRECPECGEGKLYSLGMRFQGRRRRRRKGGFNAENER
ncbi:MAG: DUF134 domain-containing protein [candidate division WOR-3 bacterium]|nr:DUF134 domain-containing protein [candidate division WOR-3 bacterium]